MLCDRIWTDARLATLSQTRPGLGVIEDGLIAASGGKIVYAGARHDAPSDLSARETTTLDGRWVTPGLIDCHTHLAYCGNRADEFERRLEGATYEEIARAGGGILSTVRATCAASESEIVAQNRLRIAALVAEGVTTIEIKSGYGLDLETEKRQLRAARKASEVCSVDVVTTFLGLHSLPPEFANDRAAFVRNVCERMLPDIAREKLADCVDGFCEGIAFTPAEVVQLFEAAKAHDLPIRLHADQLSNLRGAALAAAHGALSADHLEYADEDGAMKMAAAGTVAVLLPGAYYFIREAQKPPVEAFRKHGVKIAIATDCNPGTSPLTSPLLTMNMAATLFRLTVTECIAGFTREAARALGRLELIGTLDAGKQCDLAIWDVGSPSELVYRMGFNPLYRRVWRGE